METGQSLRQNNMTERTVLSVAQQHGLRALITTTYGKAIRRPKHLTSEVWLDIVLESHDLYNV